jgi:hypothetical protein
MAVIPKIPAPANSKNRRRLGAVAWTSEDVKDFIWAMTYIGPRLFDVAFFHVAGLKEVRCSCARRRMAEPPVARLS